MDWTKKYFDELYLKFFLETQKDEITQKQVDLISKFIKNGGYILDAGCGIGRHSIALAKCGFSVLGIDSSALYVEKAKEQASRIKTTNVEFKVLDMRQIQIQNQFDAVINIWSSFGYFDDETNARIIKNFHSSLKKDGVLILDVENRDYILKHFIYETFSEKENIFILERRKFNPLTSVISTHRYFLIQGEKREVIRHLRLYTATELINLLTENGFKIINIFGNYDKVKFNIDAQRIITIAQKI